MPYKYKKVGDKYVVYKKDTGKRVGATDGNKVALKKYLAALHINADENTTMKTTKEQILREYIRREIKKALKEEESKPDYLDADKDGNKKEPMKKAFKDKEKKG